MTYDDMDALFARLQEMTPEQRRLLDPICRALNDYMKVAHPGRGVRVLATRINALACADLFLEMERLELERE